MVCSDETEAYLDFPSKGQHQMHLECVQGWLSSSARPQVEKMDPWHGKLLLPTKPVVMLILPTYPPSYHSIYMVWSIAIATFLRLLLQLATYLRNSPCFCQSPSTSGMGQSSSLQTTRVFSTSGRTSLLVRNALDSTGIRYAVRYGLQCAGSGTYSIQGTCVAAF